MVDDAIRFVSEKTNDYLITKSTQDTVKEVSQITRPAPLTTTTNQVF